MLESNLIYLHFEQNNYNNLFKAFQHIYHTLPDNAEKNRSTFTFYATDFNVNYSILHNNLEKYQMPYSGDTEKAGPSWIELLSP